MWDEEKFFKDFVNETDKIKPDAEFIEQLKHKTNEENMIRFKKRENMRYIAMAASLLLCISIGGIGWHLFGANMMKKEPGGSSYQNEINAGKEGNEISGTIDKKDSVLVEVITMVEDEKNLLDDEQGNALSTQEREHLVELLKKSGKIDNIVEGLKEDLLEKGNSYYCVGEETVKIIVYEEQYIMIEDVIYAIEG